MTTSNKLKINILVVDDDQGILDGIRRLLHVKQPDWIVEYIVDPIVAIRYLKSELNGLDILVCDINMPMVSGLQIMKAVKNNWPKVGVVALSGQLDSIVSANKYADKHLCKPVNIDILCATILGVYNSKST